MINMKCFILLPMFIVFKVFISPNTLFAQTDSSFLCRPKEITKFKFHELTGEILSYPSIDKNIKKLSSENNCLIFITNDFDANYLTAIVFFLDSNYNIRKGFFTKFSSIDTGTQRLIPLRKKQLQEFMMLKIDTTLNQFLYCHINSLHEKWEIVININKNQLNGGLYFIGGSLISINQNERKQGLATLREKIRHLKIPKEL